MSNLSIFNGARVLITGHTGFKGSWLGLWLSQLGAQVSGVSIGVPSEPSHFMAADLAHILQDHCLDIRNVGALKAHIAEFQPDFVFHLAAQALVRRSYADPVETWLTNVMGSINVLEALRGLQNPCVAVMITSDKCYENVEWPWGYRETDALGGPDPYSASKGAAELAIRSYVRSFFPADGLVRIGVGRAGNVIGGGDWAGDRIVPDCMRAWLQGETVHLRNPSSTRPWQHVLEPLSGYLNLAMALKANADLHGQPFNFGPPPQQNHSVGELVLEMSKYWDKVRWEGSSVGANSTYESALLKLNCDKALFYLSWLAVWDFPTTVQQTILWYRSYFEQPTQSIRDFSLRQISDYVQFAQSRGLVWAQ